MVVVTTKPVLKGQEIFVTYGVEYWQTLWRNHMIDVEFEYFRCARLRGCPLLRPCVHSGIPPPSSGCPVPTNRTQPRDTGLSARGSLSDPGPKKSHAIIASGGLTLWVKLGYALRHIQMVPK